ncbi:MAG: hypothetical protein ABL962_01400, partial [Fimbriimonadaceae bacterium]
MDEPVSREEFFRSLTPMSMTIEEQARSVLVLIAQFHPAQLNPLSLAEPSCPNCGEPSASTRSPYCSVRCREISAFVRQVRNGLIEGTILGEERQVALGQKLWHLAGGGYPLRISLISDKDRVKI